MDEEECSPQPPECPSLQDLNAMSKSETPLSFARTLFDKCSTYVNSSIIILRSKDLHILNEVCLKLMEAIDSLCQPTNERKSLIKKINLFCDQIDMLLEKKQHEEYDQKITLELKRNEKVFDAEGPKDYPVKKSVKVKRLQMFKEPKDNDSQLVAKEAKTWKKFK